MKDEPIIKDNVTLENSELRKIADRVVNTAILAAQKVSVEQKMKPVKNSFEAIIQERLKAFDTKKLKSIHERITPLYNASVAIRTGLYGELGKIELKKANSIEAEVQKFDPVKINPKLLGLHSLPKGVDVSDEKIKKRFELKKDLGNFHNVTDINALTGGGKVFNQIGDLEDEMDIEEDNYKPQAVTDKLALYITGVKCVDETGYGWWGERGSDEIVLAGASVDETGDIDKISERYLGGAFDDGDSQSFHNWKWHWFSMREGGSNNWPKSYFLTLILAEKDNGGLSSFLQDLWKKIKKEVLSLIAATVGGAIGLSFGPLGAVIGTAVGYVFGRLVEWFISSWKDDIFRPRTISCTVPSYRARWTKNNRWGYTTSSRRRAHFTGHDGHYYIEYYWRLLS